MGNEVHFVWTRKYNVSPEVQYFRRSRSIKWQHFELVSKIYLLKNEIIAKWETQNLNMNLPWVPVAAVQTDHRSSGTDDAFWQAPSSLSDLILYWEYWHLDPQHQREREEFSTPHPHPHPQWDLFSHDAMPLFLNMPSSRSLVHATPSPQSPVLWIPAPSS